jgi:hypothetical protein
VKGRVRGRGIRRCPRALSEEETVKRLCGLVVAALLVLAPTAPAAAQPAAPAWQGWTWSGVIEAILGWTDGAWSAVAGSQTGDEEDTEENPEEVVPPPGDGKLNLLTVGTGSGAECEAYPHTDPDG